MQRPNQMRACALRLLLAPSKQSSAFSRLGNMALESVSGKKKAHKKHIKPPPPIPGLKAFSPSATKLCNDLTTCCIQTRPRIIPTESGPQRDQDHQCLDMLISNLVAAQLVDPLLSHFVVQQMLQYGSRGARTWDLSTQPLDAQPYINIFVMALSLCTNPLQLALYFCSQGDPCSICSILPSHHWHTHLCMFCQNWQIFQTQTSFGSILSNQNQNLTLADAGPAVRCLQQHRPIHSLFRNAAPFWRSSRYGDGPGHWPWRSGLQPPR